MKYSTYLRKNLEVRDFRSYSLENGMEKCLNKIINILKKKNKNIIFYWDIENKKNFRSSGWFGYTIIGSIIIDNNRYNIEFNWRDNYEHTTSYFKINGIEIISLTKEYTHWDSGCSTTNNYLNINNEIDNILK